MQPESGANATRRGANATRERRGCNTMRRESNALSSLNLLLKLLEQVDLNPSTSKETRLEMDAESLQSDLGRSVVVVDPFWDLPTLFSRNPSVKSNNQKILVEQKASAQAFVSWLIYATSPSGKGITKPAQFATSKLVGNTQAGAGSFYDHLAAQPPRILYELIYGSLSGSLQQSSVPVEARTDWQMVMTNASSERILALKHQLFG